MGRAVYLDRDGTIAEDVNYCRRPEDFHLLPRAGAAIALLKRAGLQLIVVTNQSGIARGYFTWETLRRIHDEMQRAIGDGCHAADLYEASLWIMEKNGARPRSP